MATIKSYTDLSQSKKLAEILLLESADMCYVWDYEQMCYTPELFGFIQNQDNEGVEHIDYPCWSLAALLYVLPAECECMALEHINYGNNRKEYFMHYVGGENTEDHDNPIDACYEMIIRLHELKML